MTASAGIRFVHTDGSSGKHWVIEPTTAGLATFDYDGDGRIDIYFLNGAPLPGYPLRGAPPRNALYRNLGGWAFEEVTDSAGVGDRGYGLGVAIGDLDNDGFPDIYISNFGANVLYRNNGDGTFTDITSQAGVATGNGIPADTRSGSRGSVSRTSRGTETSGHLSVPTTMRFRFEDNIRPRRRRHSAAHAGPKDFDP